MKIKKQIFLILFLSVGSYLNAQITDAGIDSLVEYALSKFNVAGTAVGVVKDGKIIYAKGFGTTSVKSGKPVNEYTDFAIASNSKAFTTTALAILEQEGKIKWTDKVVDYIPEFRMYAPYVTENFNIEDLLTHRSGLGLGMGDLMIFPDGTDFTMEDIIRNFQYFKPVSAFRTKYDYDNLLYLVAGELVKRVSGMTWEDFITEKILKPLEMEHTYASLDRMKDKSNLALPHANSDSTLSLLSSFEPMVNGAAGGIYSNVTDLGKWMIMHLNNGAYGDSLENRLISEKNHYEMWKIHTVMDADRGPRYNSHFKGYGLGWVLTDVTGKMSVSHTGGLPGMLSRVVMIPDIKLGVVVLTNTSDDGAGVFYSVTRAIVDSYLGLDNNKWVDKFAAYFAMRQNKGDEVTGKVWDKVEEQVNNPVDTAAYVGVYRDNWFGNIEVYTKDGEIRIKCIRNPKLKGRMFFYNANTFAVKWDYKDMNADAFAMFTLDENGKAVGFKMKGISPNIDFSFDFQDLDLKRVE
ncbi:MAG: serine hydrolase [Chlorobi bacterium]|nr:serine hydrolase [Chlorobiota bacterium]